MTSPGEETASRIPILNVIVQATLNAFLLSREYFQVVAGRHVTLEATRTIYRAHRARMIRGGFLLALVFVVLGLNLCAPLLATAWMVHRVWRLPQSPLRGHFTIAPPSPSSAPPGF